jgi:TatD DNase family protein
MAGLGLHLQVVTERSAEIKLWEQYLPQARYIGEVGLDAGPRYLRSFDVQKEVFTYILRKSAEVGGKILSVHSVRSAKTVHDLIESHLPSDRGKVVLHWFEDRIQKRNYDWFVLPKKRSAGKLGSTRYILSSPNIEHAI